ncbi:DUF2262 domain-containing protein [Brachyspira alvinipulli]|uniref:DUF2262 domain-containing protein n=1 Tax=Brachyspira alvinipulli TaxID=84379 RepID=UPI0004839002|nr:DUF2262 domain-containing protein [Brachyspira alvinipulli]
MKNKDIKDFYENDYFSYESHCDLWGDEKILLLIDFGDVPNKSEMLLKHIDKINEILKWINEHKQNISEFLISKQCLTLAEEWVSTCEELEENTYKNQLGEIINIPIKEEEFFNAMYIDTLLIDFDEDETRPDTTMHILFEPDYFKHHSLIVYVDGERNIEYGDIAG